ncbi:GNAT family N-acetyltransferase [Actinoplanes sp. NPDC026670]|uniref:GNAT family N-acetyltransferase n=1 Tax=Actinoplanes sp. NPDC026670 TaxID=3154700 RepID=UPI0034078121
MARPPRRTLSGCVATCSKGGTFNMITDIAALAADPSPLARTITVDGVELGVRALLPQDEGALVAFLAGLSGTSRRFWHGDTAHEVAAADWIEAIGRYDKLRLVAVDGTGLAGVVDLSLSLPAGHEITRYAEHGIQLDPERTARFGPCVAGRWQGRGLADALIPPAWDAIRLLGRDVVVLFGGVHENNERARRFYRRHGFVEVGALDMWRRL